MTDTEIFSSFLPLVKKEAARNFLPYLKEDTEAVARFALIKAIRTYDPGRKVPFPAYAKALVHGAVTTFLRQEKRLRERYQSGENLDFVPAVTDEAQRAEVRELLRMILATLSREEKQIFICLMLHGMTAREAALRLGVPYSRVKTTKAMIKLKLKNMLAR